MSRQDEPDGCTDARTDPGRKDGAEEIPRANNFPGLRIPRGGGGGGIYFGCSVSRRKQSPRWSRRVWPQRVHFDADGEEGRGTCFHPSPGVAPGRDPSWTTPASLSRREGTPPRRTTRQTELFTRRVKTSGRATGRRVWSAMRFFRSLTSRETTPGNIEPRCRRVVRALADNWKR